MQSLALSKNTRMSVGRTLNMALLFCATFVFCALIVLSLRTIHKHQTESTQVSNINSSILIASQMASSDALEPTDILDQIVSKLTSLNTATTLSAVFVYDEKNAKLLEIVNKSTGSSLPVVSDQSVQAALGFKGTQSDRIGANQRVIVPIYYIAGSAQAGVLITYWDFSQFTNNLYADLFGEAVLSIVLLVVMIYIFNALNHRLVVAPLTKVIELMSRLAHGDNDISVHSIDRSDEIGVIARAVEIFQQNSIQINRLKKIQLEAEIENTRRRKNLEESEAEQRLEDARLEQTMRKNAAVQAKLLKDRIGHLLEAVTAASKGNLNYPIDSSDSSDDLGRMAVALEQLFEELRGSFHKIDHNAASVAEAAIQLDALGQKILQTADKRAKMAVVASISADNVSASVEAATIATEEMNTSVREISANTSEAVSVVENAVELVQSTDASIRKLSDSSAGIGNVIKVITSIAEQTNLLALNATIEAARAGDAGKGFAVVANEVKELAKETAKATEEIESRIASIQSDTQAAVGAIGDINRIVGTINESQTTIACAVEEQKATTHELLRTIANAASGNREISDVIKDVAKQSAGNIESAEAVNSAAENLSAYSKILKESLTHYNYSVQHNIVKKAA